MALFEKIVGTGKEEDAKLPILSFMPSLKLWHDGDKTRADVITELKLTPEDEPDLDWFKAEYDKATDKVEWYHRTCNMLFLGERQLFDYHQRATFFGSVEGLRV